LLTILTQMGSSEEAGVALLPTVERIFR